MHHKCLFSLIIWFHLDRRMLDSWHREIYSAVWGSSWALKGMIDWLIDRLMIVPALGAAPGGQTCRRMLSTRRPWKTGPLALPLTLENYNKLQRWNFVVAGNVFTERRAEVTVTLKSRSSIFSSSKRKRLNSILGFHDQSSCRKLNNHRRRQRQRGIKCGCLHSDC